MTVLFFFCLFFCLFFFVLFCFVFLLLLFCCCCCCFLCVFFCFFHLLLTTFIRPAPLPLSPSTTHHHTHTCITQSGPCKLWSELCHAKSGLVILCAKSDGTDLLKHSRMRIKTLPGRWRILYSVNTQRHKNVISMSATSKQRCWVASTSEMRRLHECASFPVNFTTKKSGNERMFSEAKTTN